MKKKNEQGFARRNTMSGFVQIILILIIVAVAIGGVYYFGTLKNKSSLVLVTSTPTPIASPKLVSDVDDPTANWKTYTNTEYGYVIKVPNYLIQLQDNRGGVLSVNSASWRFGKNDMTKIDDKHKTIAQNAINLFVSVFDENASEENYNLTCQPSVLGFNINKPIINYVPVNKEFSKYVEYSGITSYDTEPDVTWWSSNLCFMYKNKFYHVNYQNFESTDVDTTFNQILSTFKFTNQ